MNDWTDVRERLRVAYRTALARGDDPSSTELGTAVYAADEQFFRETGDADARAALMAAARNAYVKLAGDVCREDEFIVHVGWNGATLNHTLPQRLSIPARTASGRRAGGSGTFPMWVDIPRQEYFTKMRDLRRLARAVGLDIAAMAKGAQLLRDYPGAATVREAIDLAGMTVDEFLAS